MMKRSVNILMVALLSVAMLTASAVSADAKTILRLGQGDPLDSEMGAVSSRFKEIIEARSKGKIEVQIFPSGQLGSEVEMLQNVRSGNLDFAIVGIANTVPFVNKMGVMTLPYLYEDIYDVVRGTTGPAHELINSYARKEGGFEVLAWTYTDYRYISNSKRPIKKLADIKGLKFRVPQSAVLLETYRSWGANPVPISWPETFTALQQGVVDGQCFGYITFLAFKFNEVQKYITEVHYTYQVQPLVASMRAMKRMSKEDQTMVVQAGREAQEYCLAFVLTESNIAKQKLIKSGIKIDTLQDEAKWKDVAVKKVWPQMIDFLGGQKAVDEYLKAMGKKK